MRPAIGADRPGDGRRSRCASRRTAGRTARPRRPSRRSWPRSVAPPFWQPLPGWTRPIARSSRCGTSWSSPRRRPRPLWTSRGEPSSPASRAASIDCARSSRSWRPREPGHDGAAVPVHAGRAGGGAARPRRSHRLAGNVGPLGISGGPAGRCARRRRRPPARGGAEACRGPCSWPPPSRCSWPGWPSASASASTSCPSSSGAGPRHPRRPWPARPRGQARAPHPVRASGSANATTLESVLTEAEFPVVVPAALGPPDAVYLGGPRLRGQVAFVYAARDDLPASELLGGAGLLLTQNRGDVDVGLAGKIVDSGSARCSASTSGMTRATGSRARRTGSGISRRMARSSRRVGGWSATRWPGSVATSSSGSRAPSVSSAHSRSPTRCPDGNTSSTTSSSVPAELHAVAPAHGYVSRPSWHLEPNDVLRITGTYKWGTSPMSSTVRVAHRVASHLPARKASRDRQDKEGPDDGRHLESAVTPRTHRCSTDHAHHVTGRRDPDGSRSRPPAPLHRVPRPTGTMRAVRCGTLARASSARTSTRRSRLPMTVTGSTCGASATRESRFGPTSRSLGSAKETGPDRS